MIPLIRDAQERQIYTDRKYISDCQALEEGGNGG